jgi:hypothetical protein
LSATHRFRCLFETAFLSYAGHEEFALEDDFFWQFAVEFDDFILVLGEGDCDDLEGAFFLRPVNL